MFVLWLLWVAANTHLLSQVSIMWLFTPLSTAVSFISQIQRQNTSDKEKIAWTIMNVFFVTTSRVEIQRMYFHHLFWLHLPSHVKPHMQTSDNNNICKFRIPIVYPNSNVGLQRERLFITGWRWIFNASVKYHLTLTRLDVLFMNHISCLANLFQFQRLKLINNVEICKTCPNFESVYDTRSGNKTIQRLSTNCQKNARQKCTTGDYILLLF